MTEPKLTIDLMDDAPPATLERHARTKISEAKPIRFAAPEQIKVLSVPTALVISVANITCLGCGSDHRDHRGLFLEKQLSNGVRALSQLSLREAGPFMTLPKRIDFAPREAIPVCVNCFQRNIEQAVAVAQVESEVTFGEPDAPRPVAEIAEEIIRAVPEDTSLFSIKIDPEEAE